MKMHITKGFIVWCFMLLLSAPVLTQQPEKIPGSVSDRVMPFIRHGHSFYLNFSLPDAKEKGSQTREANDFFRLYASAFPLRHQDAFVLKATQTDKKVGHLLQRYIQTYNNLPVLGGGLVLHFQNGLLIKANGRFYPGLVLDTNPRISIQTAIQQAFNHVKGPNPRHQEIELIIAPLRGIEQIENFRLCYKVPVLTDHALQQGIVLIDAITGEVVNILPTTCNDEEEGTAHTHYNGIQTITTDAFAGGYRLLETTRPIHTQNMQQTTNLNFAIEFVDDDNIWNEKNLVLRTLTLSAMSFPWWMTAGQTKPNIYLEFRDASNTIVAQTLPLKDSFPAYTFPIQLPLLNPPYTIVFRDDDGNPLSNDFGGQFNPNLTGPGTFTFNAFGNTGTYVIIEEQNPAVDAHWCLEETYDFFQNHFGRNSFDGAGGMIRSYVHFAFGWPNAAWGTLDSRMYLGDGDGISTSYRTYINVVAHEFTHGVIYHNGGGGLVYQGESGALNESLADIFGAAAEYYIKPGSADWLHGEEGALQPGEYIRSMENPHSKSHPDTYGSDDPYWINPADTLDAGGIHINSGVQNYWFYLLVEGGTGINAKGDSYNVTGIGWEKALQIVYRNLTTYLIASTTANFHDAWQGSLMAADDLFGLDSPEYLAVAKAWYAVGLGIDPDPNPWCSGLEILSSPTGTLSDGSQSEDYANNSDCVWLIQPDGANAITLSFSEFDLQEGVDYLYVYDGLNEQAPLLLTATGTTIPGPVTSSDWAMYLRFVTNPSGTSKGWSAAYTSEFFSFCQNEMVLTDASGSISDGSLEEQYGNLTDCSWLIQPDNALDITLTFEALDTEWDEDVIRVYDGMDANAPLLQTISGNQLPLPITSSGGSLFVHFESNHFGRYPGWLAHYEAQMSTSLHSLYASDEWQCFPNPGTGMVSLSHPQDLIPDAVVVIDPLGRTIYQATHQDIADRSLHLRQLPNGIYQIHLVLQDRTHVLNWMKHE